MKRDPPTVLPTALAPGRYECPLAPGTVCRPYLGSPTHRVVDDCGCPACALWQARHNNPWDPFGKACGYRPDDHARRDGAPKLTAGASA